MGMKFLLSFALCVFTFVAQGATPSTKSFRGSGATIVTSNDTTAQVTINTPTGTSTNINTVMTNLAVGNTIFVDAIMGNNSTAARNDSTKPFLGVSNAVAALQSGDTLIIRSGNYTVFDHGFTYVCPFHIFDKSNIVIKGEGQAILQAQGIGSMFSISNSHHITMENFTIRGHKTNAQMTAQSFAVVMSGDIHNIKFEGMTFERICNHAINTYRDSLNGGLTSYDLMVRGCRFLDVGNSNGIPSNLYDGAGIVGFAHNNSIIGNYFQDCTRDIEFYDGFNTDVSIIGNTSLNCIGNHLIANSTNQERFVYVGNVVMNMETNGTGPANPNTSPVTIYLGGLQNSVISGNTFEGQYQVIYAIDQQYPIVNVTIANNAFKRCINSIVLIHSASALISGVTVIGNTFTSNNSTAMRITGNNWVVTDNTFLDSPAGVPIIQVGQDGYSCKSTNVVIRNNQFLNNGNFTTYDGVKVDAVCYNTVVQGNIYAGSGTEITDLGTGTKFGANVYAGTGGVTTNISRLVIPTVFANTNSVTNAFFAAQAGVSNLVATNISQRAGWSSSNLIVGGTLAINGASFTNLNAAPATFTNLASVSVPAHTLTNLSDRIRADWGGRDAGALANTNNFKIVYGSQTILDTGLQVSSNFTFRTWVEITRTGNTAQHAEAHFEWSGNTGVTGLPWAATNANVDLVQTNGIDTTLALQGSAQRVGAHTNNSFSVVWLGGPR